MWLLCNIAYNALRFYADNVYDSLFSYDHDRLRLKCYDRCRPGFILNIYYSIYSIYITKEVEYYLLINNY